MHLPPGMEWNHEDVTMLYWAGGNVTTNSTNGSDITALSLTGATIASPIIMFLCGVVGNLLALLVLHRTRMESQRMMFHSLVAGLVWNDLIGIVLTSPVTIASYINGLRMPGGEHLCKFNGFIMICFGLSTPLIVNAMAIERFLFVKYTFFYTKHCVPGVARLLIVAIWAFVLFFGLLPMFGFGNYVVQYPRTWCFLDFRTPDPVHASYGYLYSGLNLLLLVVMVMCNLVVVLTLAQVRGYRRKQSSSSVTSMMVPDGLMDDSQRQQAVRRRKQKDIELQMIVVMCAITTIFVVCWAPLMIHITLTLATEGKTLDVLGLVAIRLASLNQTLNPWLYVILRRALIIRVKKYCCRWRSFLQTKPHLSPPTVGRRHQYVHVRNQLCHRSNFVGAEVKVDLLSHSLRKSFQQAIPAAMSLPDVMMVDTGRRDLGIPLPDVAKAESFAGRISHSCSVDSILTCAYCNSPVVVECIECFRERYLAPRVLGNQQGAPLRDETSKYDNKSVTCDKYQEMKSNNDAAREKNDVANLLKLNVKEHQNCSSELCPSQGSIAGIVIVNKEHRMCSKHSSQSKHSSNSKHSSDGQRDILSSAPGSYHLKFKTGNDTAATASPTPGGFLQPRGHSYRLSQHLHKPRSDSKSSSVKSTNSKVYPASRDSQLPNPSPTKKHVLRYDSQNSDAPPQKDDKKPRLDDSRDSDDVFHDGGCIPCMATANDDITTTNDAAFSSNRTDSAWLSDTSTIQNCKIKQESPSGNPGNHLKTNTEKDLDSTLYKLAVHDSPQHDGTGINNDIDNTKGLKSDTLSTLPQLNFPTLLPTHEPYQSNTESQKYNNQLSSVSNNSSCQLEEDHRVPQDDSSAESERSSGIFSAESPVRTCRDQEPEPKWQLKKESQSEPLRAVTFAKQVTRRVKSYN